MYAPRRETIHQGKPMTETDEFAPEDEDLDEDVEPEIDEDDEDLDLSDDILVDDSEDDEDDESDTDSDDEDDEALDELEAEELEMLTDDESVETLVVDEAAEMRAIRRAELAMQGEGVDEASADEFVCTSCYLVKRTSQLTNKRRKICADCAA
jgi:hypothetical protein